MRRRLPDYLAAGAVAVQAGTAIFADPTLPVRLVDALAAECARRGLASYEPLGGTALPRRPARHPRRAPSTGLGAAWWTPAEQALSVFMDLCTSRWWRPWASSWSGGVDGEPGSLRRLEDRYLRRVARGAGDARASGRMRDPGPAPPAARGAAHGVTCYRCGARRVEGAVALVDVARTTRSSIAGSRGAASTRRSPGAPAPRSRARPRHLLRHHAAAQVASHGPGEPAGPVEAPTSDAPPRPPANPAEPVR